MSPLYRLSSMNYVCYRIGTSSPWWIGAFYMVLENFRVRIVFRIPGSIGFYTDSQGISPDMKFTIQWIMSFRNWHFRYLNLDFITIKICITPPLLLVIHGEIVIEVMRNENIIFIHSLIQFRVLYFMLDLQCASDTLRQITQWISKKPYPLAKHVNKFGQRPLTFFNRFASE